MKSLEEFAAAAGVIVHDDCGPEWGGRYGYTTPDAPRCRWNGYRSRRKAIEAWANDAFGMRAAHALYVLLKHKT